MIPEFAAEGLAEFCDIFVEESAYSIEEAVIVPDESPLGGVLYFTVKNEYNDGSTGFIADEL